MKLFLIFILFLSATVPAVAESPWIQIGKYSADFTMEGWNLQKKNGQERSFIIIITFERSFESPPEVFVNMSGFDAVAGKDGTVRISVTAEKITKTGFILKITTWADSGVNGIWGTWIALLR